MSLRRFSPFWVAIFTLLLATAIGSLQLTRDALWFDEVLSYYYIGAAQYEPLTFIEFMERLISTDRWPPVYYLLLQGWSRVGGWSVFSGRVLSMFCGVLTIAVTYRLTADFSNPQYSAPVAALLLATSAFFTYFMHEIRGYTLYSLAIMLSLLFYWRMLQHITQWRVIGFVSCTLLALYTHIATYPMVTAISLYHLIFAQQKTTWVKILLVFVLVALLTLPWLFVLYFKLQQGQTIGQTTFWLPFTAFFPSFGNGVWIMLLSGLLYAAWRVPKSSITFIGFVLVASFIITIFINTMSPFLFHMRHIIGLIPLLMILVSMGAAHAAQKQPRLIGGLVSIWVIAGLWNSFDFRYMLATPGHEPTIPIQAIDTLVAAADECITADDVVILHIGEPVSRGAAWEWINDVVMVYYWRDVPFRFAHISTLDPITNDDPMGEDPQVQVIDMREYQPKAARFITGAERVWRFRLAGLSEIEQTTLLNEVLLEQGYTNETLAIETNHISGWVYTTDATPDNLCRPSNS